VLFLELRLVLISSATSLAVSERFSKESPLVGMLEGIVEEVLLESWPECSAGLMLVSLTFSKESPLVSMLGGILEEVLLESWPECDAGLRFLKRIGNNSFTVPSSTTRSGPSLPHISEYNINPASHSDQL
jgi:hypothetical protein